MNKLKSLNDSTVGQSFDMNIEISTLYMSIIHAAGRDYANFADFKFKS